MKKSDRPVSVVVPPASAEHPSWLKVGGVAVIGFVIGVVWPKVAGVRLGPNAPNLSASTATASPAEAPSAPRVAARPDPTAPPSASLAASTAATPSASPAASAGGSAAATTLTVRAGNVVGCKNEQGEKLSGKACGTLAFDALAVPRLKRLAQCPAAQGAEGKLSPTFHLDFERSKLNIQMGTKNTVDNVDSFSACLGGIFEKVSINAVTHEHPRYSVQYQLVFAKDDGHRDSTKVTVGSKDGPVVAAGAAAAAASNESGEAKIAWDTSIVRDAPRTGSIVGRLPRGTAVKVLASENNWYRVRGGSVEGWVYRGAIGR